MLAGIAQQLEGNERIGVLLRDSARFYFYPLRLPSTRFHFLPHEVAGDHLIARDEVRGLDALLCIGLEGCLELATEDGRRDLCLRVDGRFNDACVLQLTAERDAP